MNHSPVARGVRACWRGLLRLLVGARGLARIDGINAENEHDIRVFNAQKQLAEDAIVEFDARCAQIDDDYERHGDRVRWAREKLQACDDMEAAQERRERAVRGMLLRPDR